VKQAPLLLPVLRLAATTILTALMLWVLLGDQNCWQQLWPNDIQAQLLQWTGGRLRTDAADRVHSEPAFIGLLCTVLLPLLAAAVWHRRRQPASGLPELAHRTTPATVFAVLWLLLWLLAPALLGAGFTAFLFTTSAFSLALLLALLLNALPASEKSQPAAGAAGRSAVADRFISAEPQPVRQPAGAARRFRDVRRASLEHLARQRIPQLSGSGTVPW
jgi:hypothetical protein